MAFVAVVWIIVYVVSVMWLDLDWLTFGSAYLFGSALALLIGYNAYEKGLNRAGYLTELKDGTHRVGTLKGTGTGNVEKQWYNPREPK